MNALRWIAFEEEASAFFVLVALKLSDACGELVLAFAQRCELDRFRATFVAHLAQPTRRC